MKYILASVVVLVGAFATYTLYSLGDAGSLQTSNDLILVIVGACVIALVVSWLCRLLAAKTVKHFMLSVAFSYVFYIASVLVFSAVQGAFAETLMWAPVMLLFGISFMFPATLCAWLGVHIVSSKGAR
jgi:hypothetical protein